MKINYRPLGLAGVARGISFSARSNPLASLAFAGLLAALSGQAAALAADAAGAGEGQKSAPAAPAASATEIQARLLQAGAEPRKALRLHPKADDKHTSTMTMKMGMEMAVGGMDAQKMKLPAMKMVMETTVKGAPAKGDIAYETVITEAGVGDEPDAMPQMAEAMKATLSGLKGVTVTGTISPRGINKGTEVKNTTDLTPQARQAMEQMKESFCNSSVALPEEAVGVGAKWEVKQKVKSQGMTIDQTTVYELVSIEGDRLKAKTTISQTAVNQQIQNPAMPDLKMDLVKLSSKGTGEVTTDLQQLIPVQTTMDMRSESAMSMDAGGQKTEMSMRMDINLRMDTK